MKSGITFQLIDWNGAEITRHEGESGIAVWRTVNFPGLRIRIVEYSKGYIADHWCRKGHIVYCLEGSLCSEGEYGQRYELSEGTTYIVSDDLSSHRSVSTNGAKLLIIDGDFLKT